MLMEYLHTYSQVKLQYVAGGMTLQVESDTAYLVLSGTKNRIVGQFYLYFHPWITNSRTATDYAPIIIECKNHVCVVNATTEAKCGGIFHNYQITSLQSLSKRFKTSVVSKQYFLSIQIKIQPSPCLSMHPWEWKDQKAGICNITGYGEDS